ncbi:MAG: DsrE family protein [Betaproteobacteria bacterium]|nr:DsrE family protein [Betaproteobacteria bacterium]
MPDEIDYFDGLKRVGAVYDFTTGDENMFYDRINLIKLTAENFRKRGIATDFVVLIHGPSTKFVIRSQAGTKFDGENIPRLSAIHGLMQDLRESGSARIVTCGIAMGRHHVAPDNLMSFTVAEENVAEISIALQCKGYAYMQVDLMAANPVKTP